MYFYIHFTQQIKGYDLIRLPPLKKKKIRYNKMKQNYNYNNENKSVGQTP